MCELCSPPSPALRFASVSPCSSWIDIIMDMSSIERSRLEGRGITGPVVTALKLVVTLGCFVYLGRNEQFFQVTDVFRALDLRWVLLALACAVLQVPLVAWRWRLFVNAV